MNSDHHSASHLINSHNPDDYQNLVKLHSTKSTTTYKARYVNSESLVTIKVFHDYMNLELDDIFGVTRAIGLARQCINHPKIPNGIGVYCSFTHEDQLWVVMPFVEMESLSTRLKSSFPHGMSESCMSFILKETLKAIECMHKHGDVHEKITLDHIFVGKGENKDVKLDFGLLSYNEENNSSGRPLWMADPDSKSRNKVDVWMFGLLAMELFFGEIPISDQNEFMRLVSRIKEPEESKKICNSKKSSFFTKFMGGCLPHPHVRSSNSGSSGKMPSKLLGEVIVLCLDQNSLNRPTASELLKHEFFNSSTRRRS